MSQLPGVTGNNALMWLIVVALWCDLIEDGDDEYCSLAHTGFGLTENVLSLKSLRDCVDLNFTGMFEAALSDGSFEFVLKEEFVPTC